MKTASKIAAKHILSFIESGCMPEIVDRDKGY